MVQKPTYEELEKRLHELERTIARSRMAEEEITRSFDTQEVITQLIEISWTILPLMKFCKNH